MEASPPPGKMQSSIGILLNMNQTLILSKNLEAVAIMAWQSVRLAIRERGMIPGTGALPHVSHQTRPQ